MKSLFGNQYLRYANEMWGRRVIQEPWGFATYDIKGRHIYIADMFIEPELRGIGHGQKVEAKIIKIGKDAGCDFLVCKVHKTDANWKTNLKIYTDHCDYRVLEETDDFIGLVKEI